MIRPAVVRLALSVAILLGSVLLGAGVLLADGTAAAPPQAETLILIRHGEKAPGGRGHIDCQGQNRALALPGVIGRDFGRPDAIFAPDPAQQVHEGGVWSDYRRPLETVEPAARTFGLTVQTPFGYKETKAMASRLGQADLAGKTVLVAWEHKALVDLARDLLAANGGDPAQVPPWPDEDFDSIYQIRIFHDATAMPHSTLIRGRQGLDGQPMTCPG